MNSSHLKILRQSLLQKIAELHDKLQPSEQTYLDAITKDLYHYLETEAKFWDNAVSELENKLSSLNYAVAYTNERQETIADKLTELEALLDQLK